MKYYEIEQELDSRYFFHRFMNMRSCFMSMLWCIHVHITAKHNATTMYCICQQWQKKLNAFLRSDGKDAAAKSIRCSSRQHTDEAQTLAHTIVSSYSLIRGLFVLIRTKNHPVHQHPNEVVVLLLRPSCVLSLIQAIFSHLFLYVWMSVFWVSAHSS